MDGDVDHSDHITWADMVPHVARMVGDRSVARWLCETASGCDGDEFRAIHDEWVPERAGKQIESMVRRFLGGEPLQYVLGRWGFRRLDLMVDRRVLIPRPETELIVDIVLAHLVGSSAPSAVVDLKPLALSEARGKGSRYCIRAISSLIFSFCRLSSVTWTWSGSGRWASSSISCSSSA